MNPLINYVTIFILISLFIYTTVNKENLAKAIGTFSLVFLIISFSSMSTDYYRWTSEFIDEVDNPHYGLPDLWDDKQAVCFHFPAGYAPSGLDDGRHHFDFDGTDFKTDKDWNSTGACVGGFENFDNGLELFNAAVGATGNTFSYNSTQFSFGLQIDSIAGVSPCEAYTCAADFSSGAYWELLHNGAYSMVGISDLILDPDSVITWQIASY
ncbi:DUF4430 domain-containing protein [Euryarchaeota archaeon]|nr:DUF4430 domain-containing protein [Euryarchaeota archaeon]|tara:strand:- start:5335 stop:5967 length:633 start_codon:yes stop_codon:yes gene_type:complete